MAVINCPEGKIKLPVDLWYCKLTLKACPLQASIDTENWDSFNRYCLASKERQDGIRQIIISGKYTGFHHMVGRFLCPTCKLNDGDNWRSYHYPWQLEPLETYVPYDEETLRLEIIKHNIPASAQFGFLCRNCLNDLLNRLGLPSVDQQSNHNEGYGEPLNEGQPLSFRLNMSVRERHSGANPIEGNCSWCAGKFIWNITGESICYDILYIEGAGRPNDGFRLCEQCGDRFKKLFGLAQE